MRTKLISLFIALCAMSFSSAADESRFDVARASLAEKRLNGALDVVAARPDYAGIAREDLEPIVRELVDGYAGCILSALQEQAREKSVPFDDVLDAMDAPFHDTAAQQLVASLDMAEVDRKANDCRRVVEQELGILLE